VTDMESALAEAPFLAGEAYSLADAAATPYVNRLDMLGLWPCWADGHPRVSDWFARIRERPSFEAAITRHFTDKDAAMFARRDDEAPRKVRQILEAA
jgi:glutathione S-transferase